MFALGEHVQIDNSGYILTGMIAGGPVLFGTRDLCWPVRLDEGFYSRNRRVFVSVLLAAQEAISSLESHAADDLGHMPYHCSDCGHQDEEVEFWPSDGNSARHVCPNCGRTKCFPHLA